MYSYTLQGQNKMHWIFRNIFISACIHHLNCIALNFKEKEIKYIDAHLSTLPILDVFWIDLYFLNITIAFLKRLTFIYEKCYL